MDLKIFRFFIRKNYSEFSETLQLTNYDLDELGKSFNEYLEKLPIELVEKITPKNEIEVIMNIDHPLKMNGFHPALLLHFNEYINERE
jgi:hypothetical protein